MSLKQIFNLAKKKVPHPKTVVATDKKMKSFFTNPQRDLKKYETIYRQGGLVSQAIDAYALFALADGYTFTGASTDVKKIEQWAQDIDLDSLVWHGIVDALVYGDCIQENVMGRGGEVQYLIPRNPSYFTINFDKWGIIKSYTQRAEDNDIPLKPELVTHFQLMPLSGENYGQSLIARAYDDIIRDTETAESTAVAIKRHGYPRYHVKAGSLEHETEYSDNDKRTIAREFEELKADNEFVTNPDIDIVPIDIQGVHKIASYNEWSLSRLLGALGVPSEVIGTGQSTTTYATASVEMVSFLKKIKSIQKRVARTYNKLIDIKTGNPGSVVLELNEPDLQGLANVDERPDKNKKTKGE